MNKILLSILTSFMLCQSVFADRAAVRNEAMQHVLHFAALSHLVVNHEEKESLSERNQEIVSFIATSASVEIAHFKETVNANENMALRKFAQYLLDVCSNAGLKERMFVPFQKTVLQTDSIENIVALIKRAVKAIDVYANGLYEKPLYKKVANTLVCNYITTRFIPNTLMYVIAPSLAVLPVRRAIEEFPWGPLFSEDLYRVREVPRFYYRGSHSSRDWQSDHDEAVRIHTVMRKHFVEDMGESSTYLLIAACLAGTSYFAGKLIMKLQEQTYLARENSKQKNALLNAEMERVVITQAKEKSKLMKLLAKIPWLKQQESTASSIVPTDVKNAAEYLHNPSSWWKKQTPGTRAIVIEGSEASHKAVTQALAKEANTGLVEISFLKTSYKEKVQAIMNRAQAHAITQPNKSVIIHIDNIDFIASGSKAAKNIAQIIFNAQNNPYLNILVIGSVQNRAQIPHELKPYFA